MYSKLGSEAPSAKISTPVASGTHGAGVRCADRVGGHRVSGEDRQFEAVPRIEGNDVLRVRRNDQLLVAARELEGLRVLGRRTFRAAAGGEKRGRSDARADAEETASRQVVHDRPVVAIGRGGRKESSHAC